MEVFPKLTAKSGFGSVKNQYSCPRSWM